MKKIPLRRCVVTKEQLPKGELLRIVKNKENEVFVDLTGKANGRGAYICPSKECFAKAVKSKGLERSFKHSIPKEVYDKLEKELDAIET